MKLEKAIIKLPLQFDSGKLAKEIEQFSESDWQDHPQQFAGNAALLLVAVDGDSTNDDLKGSMAITPHLEKCEYLQQVLASFKTTLGRTRLMRLEGEATVKPHVDQNYYWLQRVRIHIPIVTNPEVTFHCGGEKVHMAEGSAWIFNTWLPHQVINLRDEPRIHLVIDTVGSAEFWNLVEKNDSSDEISYQKGKAIAINTEKVNAPIVMSPWEQQHFFNFFLEDLREAPKNDPDIINRLSDEFRQINRQWHDLWVRYGTHSSGWGAYQEVLQEIVGKLEPFAKQLEFSNSVDFFEGLKVSLLANMFNPKLGKKKQINQNVTPKPSNKPASQPSTANMMRWKAIAATLPKFERPIFIVSAPRSGSSFLFETLAKSSSVWTIGGESHGIFESIPQLQPEHKGYKSNSLGIEDADLGTAVNVKLNFSQKLRDSQGNSLSREVSGVRMLEKTPKNALRIPFLNAIFPDALFIYLYRDPHENVSSIMEAWQSGRFVTYPNLPNW
ncbi:MAG: aspartyl/asparaginyl beta-hydroxylase domain-containing protein, partial [Cyanobacteria bacterium J06631_2]